VTRACEFPAGATITAPALKLAFRESGNLCGVVRAPDDRLSLTRPSV